MRGVWRTSCLLMRSTTPSPTVTCGSHLLLIRMNWDRVVSNFITAYWPGTVSCLSLIEDATLYLITSNMLLQTRTLTHSNTQYCAPGESSYNTIYIIFEEPVCIGCIKMWNYSKTVERGVKEFEVCPDNIPLLYSYLQSFLISYIPVFCWVDICGWCAGVQRVSAAFSHRTRDTQ